MHFGGRLHTERYTEAFLSSCRSKYLSHTRIPNSFQIFNKPIMSKPRSSFQIKIYASYWFILEFFHTERVVLSLCGENFLNEQCCCQTNNCSLHSFFPTEKVYNTLNLPPQGTTQLHRFGKNGEGDMRLPFLEHFLTGFSINSNLKFYSLWSDEMVGRQEFFFCFVKKSFCFQSRTTLERSLQTDNTPTFEELYFHQIFFFVKS